MEAATGETCGGSKELIGGADADMAADGPG